MSKKNTEIINLVIGLVIHILSVGAYAYKLNAVLKEKDWKTLKGKDSKK